MVFRVNQPGVEQCSALPSATNYTYAFMTRADTADPQANADTADPSANADTADPSANHDWTKTDELVRFFN